MGDDRPAVNVWTDKPTCPCCNWPTGEATRRYHERNVLLVLCDWTRAAWRGVLAALRDE